MFKKIILLVPHQEKRHGLLAILSMLLKALLEFAGLALFVPLIFLLFDQNSLQSNYTIHWLYGYLGFTQPSQFILFFSALILLLIVLKNVLTYRLTIFQTNYLLRLYRYYALNLFTSYFRKGALFFKSNNANNLTYHVNFISYTFVFSILSALIKIAPEGMLLILLSVTIAILNMKVFLLLAALFLPAIYFYSRMIKGRLVEIGNRENISRKRQTRIVHEAFKGYSEVEINDAFPLLLKNYEKEQQMLSDCRLESEKIRNSWERMLELGAILGILVILLINFFLVGENSSFRVLFALLTISLLRLLPSVKNIIANLTQVKTNHFVWEIIEEVFVGNEQIRDQSEQQKTILFANQIDVQHLFFNFEKGKEIFKDLSLSISKGEKVGIKGLSGSGKSTLFNLLLGLYPPTKGSILIDGVKLTPAFLKSWHRMVGYVSQDVFILDATLAQNVALGVELAEFNREKVILVLQKAGLGKFLTALPEGLESMLGDGGCKVSGGERQRIGIARALYKDAEVLFFDEATSSVDTKTELEINESIAQLFRDQKELTILVIAHRESSLNYCDRIIEL